MEDLRVTLVQTALAWEAPAQNRDNLLKRLRATPAETDLIILPEMFTTGFSMNAQKLAEPEEGPTTQWMRNCAKEFDACVIGSIIAAGPAGAYNRLIWMFPDGHYQTYDKRHLFTLAGEDQHYRGGASRLIAEYKGWKICPLICYDLRFPVWSRNTVPYDLLLYVANWPERRNYAWKQLLIARAIENQVYTIGVNRVGRDENDILYSGDTSLIDFEGKVLYRAAYLEDVYSATLSSQAQRDFRRKLQFLADRDTFTIQA